MTLKDFLAAGARLSNESGIYSCGCKIHRVEKGTRSTFRKGTKLILHSRSYGCPAARKGSTLELAR